MNEALIENWNSVVKPEDKVYHLGDVYMGGARGYTENLLVHRLHGHKRLILGNHDNGKDQILHKAFEKIDVWRMFPEFGLLLTHVPVHDSALHKTGRRGQPDYKLLNVHVHIHEKPAPSADHFCVCVERTKYTPINIDELRIK
jgi:calcineurin-like phosphoesterase family protein